MPSAHDHPADPPSPESLALLEGPAFRRADLLLILPFIWQLALAPWANGVMWRPLGLPFPMVWQMAGILFATAMLALRYRLDRPVLDRPVREGGAKR